MFRIQHILLIAAAGLCSCATERTVTTSLQPKQRPDSAKTDAELMDALEAKFAGGFGQQTDKEGNTKMVSQKRSSFEGLRYNGDMSQFEKKAFETTAFEKKKFDGAATQFETRKWDGVKSFTDGKLETPDFIARGQGREYPVLARCLQTIRHAAIRPSGPLLEGGGQTPRTHRQPGH